MLLISQVKLIELLFVRYQKNTAKKVQKNLEYFSKLIDILLFMSRQGIPFRTYFEDKDSLNKCDNISTYVIIMFCVLYTK